jgi:hypothetical protein
MMNRFDRSADRIDPRDFQRNPSNLAAPRRDQMLEVLRLVSIS